MHVLLDEGQPPRLPVTSDGRRQGYATTFHPGARVMDAAKPITLALGEQRSGVDIPLEPVPLFSVMGSLTGPPGAIGRVRLFLMPRGTEALGVGHEAATTVSAADGRFAFPEVPAGEYTLMAGMTAAGYVHPLRGGSLNDVTLRATSENAGSVPLRDLTRPLLVSSPHANAAYTGRMTVRVTSADVAGVTVPLQRGVTIRGRFVQDVVRLGIGNVVPTRSSDGEPQTVRAESAAADPMLGLPQTLIDFSDIPPHDVVGSADHAIASAIGR
jgi:hypothetical protein